MKTIITLKNFLSLTTITFSLLFSSCDAESINDDLETTVENDAEMPQTAAKATTGVFNWDNWYLSVPINNGSNKATSIFSDDLKNANFTSAEDDYVWKNSNGTYTFKSKFTGYTTSGKYGLDEGKFCRTELREFWQGNNDTGDNWVMDSDTHLLESKMKVVAVGGDRKRTYIAQIHGYGGNNPATVKVGWQDGMVNIIYYTKPSSGNWTSGTTTSKDLGYVGHSPFTIKLKVENGKMYTELECLSYDLDTGFVYHYDYKANGYNDLYENYFKTGNYINWNEDYTETSIITMYGINTAHGAHVSDDGIVSSSRTVSIRGNNARYVSSEDGSRDMVCDRFTVEAWEKFELITNSDNTVSLKGSNGEYVSSEDGRKAMRCNRPSIGDWEKFTIHYLGSNLYALKGNNGKYVSSEDGRKGMRCDRSDIGGWEKFIINDL